MLSANDVDVVNHLLIKRAEKLLSGSESRWIALKLRERRCRHINSAAGHIEVLQTRKQCRRYVQ